MTDVSLKSSLWHFGWPRENFNPHIHSVKFSGASLLYHTKLSIIWSQSARIPILFAALNLAPVNWINMKVFHLVYHWWQGSSLFYHKTYLPQNRLTSCFIIPVKYMASKYIKGLKPVYNPQGSQYSVRPWTWPQWAGPQGTGHVVQRLFT